MSGLGRLFRLRLAPNTMSWKLKRTKQCAKCPWKVSTNPHEIPNGYDPARHCALSKTIAKPGDVSNLSDPMSAMACHETHNAHCVGWVHHQLGGNNIGLRIRMMSCSNIGKLELDGEQHESFEDTLPQLASD